MSIVLLVPLIVCIVGALVYALSNNAKIVELARILYFVGLLWTVYAVAARVVKF